MITKIQNFSNCLDKLTIEECIKYAAQGFDFLIEDGHVKAMNMTKEAPKDAAEN